MKIPPKLMSKAVKDFKFFGTLSSPLVQRRLKVSYEMALAICNAVETRYPNLWKEGREKLYAGKKKLE